MIGQYLREACQTVPGETFLATPDRQYTYREAAATVAGLATWLQCRKTTRLLLYLRDSPELIFLLFAGSLAGCQTGVANRRSSPKELAELCRRFGFEQILADDAIAVPGISVECWPDWKAGSSPEACVDAPGQFGWTHHHPDDGHDRPAERSYVPMAGFDTPDPPQGVIGCPRNAAGLSAESFRWLSDGPSHRRKSGHVGHS